MPCTVIETWSERGRSGASISSAVGCSEGDARMQSRQRMEEGGEQFIHRSANIELAGGGQSMKPPSGGVPCSRYMSNTLGTSETCMALKVVQGRYDHARPLHHPKAETQATVHHPNLPSPYLTLQIPIDLPARLVFTASYSPHTSNLRGVPLCLKPVRGICISQYPCSCQDPHSTIDHLVLPHTPRLN